ncbi:hypothetical protein HanRHA438_Chr15g0733661 [Helianthus annuus]|uniref:Uncharacterized protein n=1 Tax=Helianthus annuus TaxID=4232 RepID=A0A9K3H5B0_HELAN|nr:hypothetical protein HanXRQr2_Chr15g0721061 [Helianthus annuus]KAJ0453251.1 hypothetical protein HanHA300_Chr15g0588251 [Helianthus annuus]KAJ0475166.1 hypothetical protein HanHA89_Chr15g0638051 [Helianthus annuus]KAJ0650722.1 hypothetical protein HanLR1_Chr15g0598971 [Helianthus annuus]KAJ0654475.1 hypothetical protein HanOQP8_Chr15g0595401 [Helianthus annuus]
MVSSVILASITKTRIFPSPINRSGTYIRITIQFEAIMIKYCVIPARICSSLANRLWISLQPTFEEAEGLYH